MPVAPRIVNDVSYERRINHEIHFAWQAQYLVRLEGDACCSGKWLRLPMAIEILMHFWMCSITLPSSTDVNSFRKRH